MRYHIARAGQSHGPFTEAELREHLARGTVIAGDSIWHEGLAGWQSVSSLFPDASATPPPPVAAFSPAAATLVPSGTTGFVLGFVNLITWIIPLIGLPLAIWGLVASIKAKTAGAGGKATAGLVLNILALLLVIANAAIGAYLGATGQHPLLK